MLKHATGGAWLTLLMAAILGGAACGGPATDEEVIAAAGAGDSRKLEQLLAGGGSPNARDRRGFTALTIASLNGDVPVMDVLLRRKAQMHMRGTNPDALMLAVQSGNTEAATLLLKHGAPPDGDPYKPPPLGLCTSVEMARTLVEAGAHPHIVATSGRDQPLHAAIRRGQLEVARYLVEVGADVNFQNARGQSPLQLACVARSAELLTGGEDRSELMIRFLLSKGASPDQTDERGNSAAHYLARNSLSTPESLQALADAGATLGLPNDDGTRPLDMAVSVGRPESDPFVILLRRLTGDRRKPRTLLPLPQAVNPAAGPAPRLHTGNTAQ